MIDRDCQGRPDSAISKARRVSSCGISSVRICSVSAGTPRNWPEAVMTISKAPALPTTATPPEAQKSIREPVPRTLSPVPKTTSLLVHTDAPMQGGAQADGDSAACVVHEARPAHGLVDQGHQDNGVNPAVSLKAVHGSPVFGIETGAGNDDPVLPGCFEQLKLSFQSRVAPVDSAHEAVPVERKCREGPFQPVKRRRQTWMGLRRLRPESLRDVRLEVGHLASANRYDSLGTLPFRGDGHMDRLTGSQTAASHPHVHGNRIGQPPGVAGLMQRLEQIRDRAHADPAVRNADPSLRPKVHHDLGAHTGLVPDDARIPRTETLLQNLPLLRSHSVSSTAPHRFQIPPSPLFQRGEAMWSHAKHGAFLFHFFSRCLMPGTRSLARSA